MTNRSKRALKGAVVLMVLAGAALLLLANLSTAPKEPPLKKVTVPTTLAPVGIWQGTPRFAVQGTFVGSETLGILPANSGFTIVSDCTAPGSLDVTVDNVMSGSGKCNGRATSDISWSVMKKAQVVRVSSTSGLWRVAIYRGHSPVPLRDDQWTNI
jgi:hypothetical protein